VKSEMATFFDAFPGGIIAGNTFQGVGYDTVLLGQADPRPIDIDEIASRLQQPEYAAVAESLHGAGIDSAIDLFASYAGRARDLAPWLRGAAINTDGNLRLHYLAGVGLNLTDSDRVYGEMLKYRRFPQGLFVGSVSTRAELRERIEKRGLGTP